MKFMKKFLSVISAISLVVTMSASLIAYAENPSLALNLTETDTGVYELAINLDTNGLKVYSIGFKLNMPLEKFDSSIKEYDDENEEYVNIVFGGKNSAFYSDIFSFQSYGMNYQWQKAKGQANTSATDIITISNLKLAEGVETDDIDITLTEWTMNVDNVTYGVAAQQPDVVIDTIPTATFPGNKTDDGGNDDDTPTITKVGSFADGENDKAVAYMYETTAVAGNTVTAKATVTLADDTTEIRTLSKAVNADVETNGAVALGIIVQFGADYKDVVITEMAIN